MRSESSRTPFYLTIPFWGIVLMSVLAVIVMSILPNGLDAAYAPRHWHEVVPSTAMARSEVSPPFGEQLDEDAPVQEDANSDTMGTRINQQVKRIKESPAIEVSATDLLQAYERNRAEANHTYLNRVIELEGIVADVDDVDGHAAIQVVGRKEWAGKSILCPLIDSDQPALKKIKLGQEATLRGINKGVHSNTEIVFSKCVLKD